MTPVMSPDTPEQATETLDVFAPKTRPERLRYKTNMDAEEARRSTFVARLIYAFVFTMFVSLCVLAVTTTMAMEKTRQQQNRTGFRAITVKRPVSFFDKTYLNDEPAQTPNAQQPRQ